MAAKIELYDIPTSQELQIKYLSSKNILGIDIDRYISRVLKLPSTSQNSRDAFKKWRQQAFKEQGKAFFENMLADSPQSFSDVKDDEWRRIIDMINAICPETFYYIWINSAVADNEIYDVANIAGWLDYLKTLEIRPLFQRIRNDDAKLILRHFLIDCGLIHDEQEQCIRSFNPGSKGGTKLWAAMLVLSKYHEVPENKRIITGSTDAKDILKSYLVQYTLPLVDLKSKGRTTVAFEKEFTKLLSSLVKKP